jgi:hypothetical protein
VNRVAWAHPEFGQIVASCSNDKTVSESAMRGGCHAAGFLFSAQCPCFFASFFPKRCLQYLLNSYLIFLKLCPPKSQVKIWEERKGSVAAFVWTQAAAITDFRDSVSGN